jgi:hypothetical protein
MFINPEYPMHRTLDSLIQEQALHKKTARKHMLPVWLQEAKVFLAIFVAIFFGMLVFTNANLFMHALGISHSAGFDTDSLALVNDDSIADITVEQDPAIEILAEYTHGAQDPLALDVQTVLENKLSYYSFDFNTLPPVDRVIIAGISLDVPLVSVTTKAE